MMNMYIFYIYIYAIYILTNSKFLEKKNNNLCYFVDIIWNFKYMKLSEALQQIAKFSF